MVIEDSDAPIKLGYNTYIDNAKGLFADCPLDYLYIGRDYDSGAYDGIEVARTGFTPFPATISALEIGEKMSSIPNYFLYFGNKCETIILPESITYIGYNAFRNSSNLKSINIPELVTEIKIDAFEGCNCLVKLEFNAIDCENGVFPTSITEVTFGDKVTMIPGSMLKNSQITQVEFPESLKIIGEEAFRNTKLNSIFLPPGIESVGREAFYNCGLLQIVYPATLDFTYSHTNSGYFIAYPSDYFKDEYGVIYDNKITEVFYAPKDLSESYSLPASIIEIGETAFYNCKNIKNITIGENVTIIGDQAFTDCLGLENLMFNAVNCNGGTFPSSIKKVVIGEEVRIIPDNFLMYSEIEDLYLPESIEKIGEKAFYENKNITHFNIPKNTVNIGYDAFYGCENVEKLEFNAVNCDEGIFPSSIKNLVIGEEVKIIPDNFLMYSEIEDLYLPESIEKIGEKAFYENKNIKNVTIPKNVKEIYDGAFYGCDSFTTLIYNARDCEIKLNTSIYQHSFSVFPTNFKYLEIGGEVVSIPSYFISENNTIERIIIPNNVSTINEFAFYNCSNIKSFLVGSGVNTIDQSAFAGSKIIKLYLLPEIYFNPNLTSFPMVYTISAYPNLSSYFIEDGLMYIPVNLSERTCDVLDIWNSDEITELIINPTVTHNNINFSVQNIGSYAFYGVNNIERIILNNDGDVNNYAIYGCENLKEVDFNNKGKIGSYACSANEKLSLMNLGESITQIDDFAFSECNQIKELKLPDSLSVLGNNVFENCNSLQSVYLGKSLKCIPSYSFNGCSSLTSLNIPQNIDLFYDTSIKGCESLTDINFEDETNTTKEKHEIEFPEQNFMYTLYAMESQDNVIGEYIFYANKGDILDINFRFNYQTGNTAKNLSFLIGNTIVRNYDLDTGFSINKHLNSSFRIEFDSDGKVDLKIKVYGTYIDSHLNVSASLLTTRDMCFFIEESDMATFSDCPLNNCKINRNFSFILKNRQGNESVKYISPFDQNLCLKTIEIGDNVDTIFESEFAGCSSLSNFIGGENIERIDDLAFLDCTSLTNIFLDNNLESTLKSRDFG